ncbi:hypothetical protein C0992_011200 [Termitomyces sp. T32_za158]|nr:hypothetical protein C0992_011200 [Termitomyces sp. T32_za158]
MRVMEFAKDYFAEASAVYKPKNLKENGGKQVGNTDEAFCNVLPIMEHVGIALDEPPRYYTVTCYRVNHALILPVISITGNPTAPLSSSHQIGKFRKDFLPQMTRITNFGRKRTYLEATSQDQANPGLKTNRETAGLEETQNVQMPETAGDLAPPPKKKRKRTKLSMRDGNTGVKAAEAAVEQEKRRLEAEARAAEGTLSKSAKKKMREKAKKEKVLPASEWRRIKRINEKLEKTICYACRQKGHAAKDCPSTEKPTEEGQTAKIVGVCYRCGSSQHTLSRCKKGVDQANPLPFASCFVCNGKGHLASSCPQNTEKGVYPNGGCCKLCGDTTHLAKDCGLRKNDIIETKDILGVGDAIGADEDDFHSFRRQRGEIDRSEKHEEKDKRVRRNKATTHASLPSKRVVHF